MYTVLVVDDDRSARETVTGLVKGEDYNPLQADSATSALAVVQSYPVDVVLCADSLPDNDSEVLLSAIKQQFPTIEVIMVTKLSALEAVKLSIRNPAFKYISSPVDATHLAETLSEAVARVRSQEDVLQDLTQLNDEKQLLVESLREEQQSLSRLESEFRSFTENSGDLFLRIDQQQRLTYANTACRKLLGFSHHDQEPAPLFFRRVIHSADLELFQQGLESIFTRQSTFETLSLRVRTPDQSTRWVQLSITAISTGEEFLGVTCTIHDRTDNYIAQYNLKQSNRNLHVLKKFDDLLSQHLDSDDLEEQVLQALVREFNLTAALMLAPHSRGLQLVAAGGRRIGLADGEVLEPGEQLDRLLNSPSPVQVASWQPEEYAGNPWESLGNGETLQVGFLHCSLSEGLQRYILLLDANRDFATVSNLHLLSLIVTSLARSIANNLLFRVIRDAKSDWEATFDSMPDMIAVVDKAACILLSNRALAQFANQEAASLEGTAFCDLFFSRDDPLYQEIEQLIKRGESNTLASNANPREQELLFRIVPNIFSSKKISIITVQDITEEQQMLERNRELELQLFQEARLSSIGLLASGIAHNLNGPLMTIMGSLELALSRDPESETLRRVQRQSQVMKEIIGNLLTKSRRDQETFTRELDLNQLLQEQLDFLNADMRYKHQLKKRINLDLAFPHIRGVYSDFSQVVNAILNNCIEAMAETERKELLVRTTFNDGKALLEIADTGSGMDRDTQESMFDPFFTTKQALDPASADYQGGSGLGMTTVYNILKNYQIRIEVDSAPGQGTKFFIYFPSALQVTTPQLEEKVEDHE
ncbi:MAG: PAS domain S-box protein [Candidatus Delongbacteria bacterium]|nr:PAS domain S-box protein [bacterium]MBL7033122.1 PAS domain S-box protein [Candidatus Delongbacteria bacterium]